MALQVVDASATTTSTCTSRALATTEPVASIISPRCSTRRRPDEARGLGRAESGGLPILDTFDPAPDATKLLGRPRAPGATFAGASVNGSDGTRTRDLRRDRPTSWRRLRQRHGRVPCRFPTNRRQGYCAAFRPVTPRSVVRNAV